MKRKTVSISVFLMLILTVFTIVPTNVYAQGGDFEISVFPESQIINPGGSVEFLVTVTSIDGFDSPVDLSVEGLPDDTTASFNPNIVTPTDYSILTISTSEDTPTGGCSITIIGTSGVLTHSTSTTIEIDYGLLPEQFGTFTGRVTSCDNPEDGIEGVTVRACEYYLNGGYKYNRNKYGNEEFTCRYSCGGNPITNEDGYYTITDVPLGPDNAPRDWVVSFHIAGYSATHHIATASAGTITTVDMELCHAGITGTVVDDDTGYPIEGAEIYTDSDISGSLIEYAYATTDANGEYTLYNMPLGADNGARSYSYVKASADGYCYQIESIDITSGFDSTLDFTLIPKKYGTFTGQVTSCDNPEIGIEGVTVLACEYNYWGYDYTRNEYGNEVFTCHYNCGGSAITNENGYYTIENVPLGDYPNCNNPREWVVAFHIEGYSATHHIATASAETITTVDMELCHAGITGTVVDDDTGYPIEGAEIYTYSLIGGSYVELLTTTNDEEVYNLPNIPLGADNGARSYSYVKASADGYCYQIESIDITSGSTSTLDFSLIPIKYGTFTGQVTDLDTGESIAGVNVYAVEYENIYNGYLHLRSNGWDEWKEQKNGYMLPPVTADSDGYYTIENVPLGDYPNCNNPSDWVVVSHIEGYSATHHIATAEADNPTTVDMKLCHAGITGKVVDADSGDPIEGAFLSAYSGILGSEVYAYAYTDEEGIYSLLNLPVGADHEPRYYTVTASAAGYCAQTKYGTIFCGGVITLDFAGPEEFFGTIYGTVTDCLTGGPIEGAFIGGQFGDYTFTDDSGQYIFTDVPVEPDGSPKTWEVTAQADGYESQTKSVDVSADETSILDFALCPPNLPPVADANGPYENYEGSPITFDASASSDPDGDSLQYRWDLENDGTWDTDYSTDPTFIRIWFDDYSGTVAVEVYDGLYTDIDIATVTVYNVAPAITTDGDIIDEGDVAMVSGTITDPGTSDTFTMDIDWGEGTPETFNYPAGTTSFSETHQYLDDDPTITSYDNYTVGVTVTDKDGGVGTASTIVTVNNVAPEITDLTLPVDPVDISNSVDLTGTFTDQGTLDTHTATIDWGDETTSGTVTESTVTGTHTYTDAGVYTVTLTVTDDDGGIDTETFQYIVVYDPNDGFVTGGGWIDSPEGAYTPNPTLTGKATFGFVSKYKKGQQNPTGNTEFQFHAAGMNFHSDSYDWLVIAGAKAMYKGTGTINGSGNFGFMLSAIDEKLTPGTDVDLFRIKIWDKDKDDEVIYDNQIGDDEYGDPTTAISNGQIVIHKG